MAISNSLLFTVTLFSAIGSGLIAGIFLAFSAFVMTALSRIASNEGIAAMQSINIAVINPIFLLIFLGTTVANIFIVIAALLRWQEPASVYWLAGGLVYVIGCFLVTLVFNVPRNNTLAAVIPTDPASQKVWSNYLSGWTAWNHFRMLAALVAAILLTVALSQ